jgi:hypothetical protein
MQVSVVLVSIAIILIIIAISMMVYVFLIKQNPVIGLNVVNCTAPPAAPTGVVLSLIAADGINVIWDTTPVTDTYRIYLSNVNGFSISQAQIVKSTANTSIQFGGLATGFTYYIKVAALNSCGESLPSTVLSIFIPYKPPSSFIIRNNGEPTIQLSMDPLAGANAYRNFLTQNCTPGNCHYQFNPEDNTILLSSDTTRCLTVVSTTEVWTVPCTSSTLPNRQWLYNPEDNSLCATKDLTNACLLTPPGFNNPSGLGSYAVIGTKTENAISQWDLVQV